jgi:tetratricopeptide (TPR) repeat protein
MQKSASLIIFLIICAVNGFGVSDPVIKAKSGSIGKHEGNQLLEQAISKIKNLEFDEARTLLEECIIWGTTANDSILLASSYYYLGDCFYYLQDFDKAMECYQGNLSLVEQVGDTLLIARTLNSIGIIHNLKLDFDLAINNFILAANLIDQCAAKNIVLNSEKINSLVNINNIYIDLGEYDKVIKNAFKIIELSKTINDKRNLGLAYNNLGISYSNQGKFQEAKESYFQTMSLLMETGNKHELSFVYNNLGNLYEKTMEYDSALYYLNLSHDQFKNSGNNIGIARAQVGIASVLAFLNRPDDARQMYLETIKTYNDDTHHQTLLIAYKGLHELEYQQGNYKMAYQYLIKYTSMTDSIFSIEQSQLISELQTKYETDIKEAELSLLKSEKQQRETILKMNRWLSWLGFSSAVMFLALTFYTLSQLIQKRKANTDLKNKNELIEDINDQLIELNNEISNINNKLQESENELIKSNNSKDMFFSIIAHELRNPFHHV